MSEIRGTYPISIDVVDFFIYFLPGSVMMFVLYLNGLFGDIFKASLFNNSIMQILIFLIGSYLLGHIMHFPAMFLGTIINKVFGEPVRYLIGVKQVQVGRFKTKLRQDFHEDYKLKLRKMLGEYWKISDDLDDLTDLPQYFMLSEVLIEEKLPRGWEIHERFYLRSCLMRGLILPTILLGITIILMGEIIMGIGTLLASVLFIFRYYSLFVVSIKQIYNQFYYHRVMNGI